MTKRRRVRKSRKNPDPHVARCSGFLDNRATTTPAYDCRSTGDREQFTGNRSVSYLDEGTPSVPDSPADHESMCAPGRSSCIDEASQFHRSTSDLITQSIGIDRLPENRSLRHDARLIDDVQQVERNSKIAHVPSLIVDAEKEVDQDTQETSDCPSDSPCPSIEIQEFDTHVLYDFRDGNAFDMFDMLDQPSEEVRQSNGHHFGTALSSINAEQSDRLVERCSTADSILKSVRSSISKPTLLGIITLYGKSRFTLENYEHLVALMKDSADATSLPCASTLRQKVFPKLLSTNFVSSSVQDFRKDDSAPTNSCIPRVPIPHERKRMNKDSAVVVLPSSWAKLDVRSLHVLREFACINCCRCNRAFGKADLRLETTPIISNKRKVFSKSDFLWVNNNGTPSPANVNTSIRINIPSATIDFLTRRLVQSTFKGESCKAIDGHIIATEHVVHSSSSGSSIQHGLPPGNLDISQYRLYTSCVSFLRGLCEVPNANDDESDLSSAASMEDGGSTVGDSTPLTRREKRSGRITYQNVQQQTIKLLPGDHITILSIDSPNSIVIYISRYWVNRLSDDRNLLVHIDFNNSEEPAIQISTTLGAPNLQRDSPRSTSQETRSGTCHTTGFISGGSHDGKRFYRYRILLYADDFNARSPLFPKGSVGGFYMSPSGLSVNSRRSQSTVRTISLTPTGISTNFVFDYIIDDLINGSIDGVPGTDAYGDNVIIYLEVTGFVGDYPASSAVVDLKGHMASSPCTLCTFPRSVLDNLSRYAFTSKFHSCHNSFRRSQHRSTSIHSFGLSEGVAKNLGMKVLGPTGLFEKGRSPLLKFAALFNRKLKVRNFDTMLHDQLIDGYELNVIAPDHLLTGLIKGLLTLCFLHLPCETIRKKLTTLLRDHLLQYGFQTQSTLFKRKKLVPGLSMSTLYCILCILPAILESLGVLHTLPIKSMLFNLHRFSSLLFWWPSLESDGASAWDFVHGSNIRTYHRTLQLIAMNTIKSVNSYCKSHRTFARHIDRPNIHRLLELATHTIPNYNHVLYICELVYESAHQPLKFFLSKNNSSNAHIYAVHSILAKDWMLRLWALWKIHKSDLESQRDKSYAILGIIRLLAGEKADDVDWQRPEARDVFLDLKDHIHLLFEGTVEKRLEKWYADLVTTRTTSPRWVAHTEADISEFTSAQQVFFEKVIVIMKSLSLQADNPIKLYSSALLDRGFGSASKGHHERLHLGDVIQLLLPKGYQRRTFLDDTRSTDGVPHFFVVGGLLQSLDGVVWACLQQCSTLSTIMDSQIPAMKHDPILRVSTSSFYSSDSDKSVFIRLTGDVRKVGVVHDCSSSSTCTLSPELKSSIHSSTTLDGGTFLLFTKAMGFPPRRS